MNEKTYQKWYKLVLKQVKNSWDAEDVTQEIFLAAHRCAHQFKGISTYDSWFSRIKDNCIKQHFRDRNKKCNQMIELVDFTKLPETPYEINLSINKSLFKNGLTPFEFRALSYAAEGYGPMETCKLFKVSLPAAKSALKRARTKVSKNIAANL